VRNRRQGEQERQGSEQGSEAKSWTAHHREVIYTKFGWDYLSKPASRAGASASATTPT